MPNFSADLNKHWSHFRPPVAMRDGDRHEKRTLADFHGKLGQGPLLTARLVTRRLAGVACAYRNGSCATIDGHTIANRRGSWIITG